MKDKSDKKLSYKKKQEKLIQLVSFTMPTSMPYLENLQI